MDSVRGGIEDCAEVALALCLPGDDAGGIDVVLHIGRTIVCTFTSSSAWLGFVERTRGVRGLGWWLGVTRLKGAMDERGGRWRGVL